VDTLKKKIDQKDCLKASFKWRAWRAGKIWIDGENS
jgi:hypothetical protein